MRNSHIKLILIVSMHLDGVGVFAQQNEMWPKERMVSNLGGSNIEINEQIK